MSNSNGSGKWVKEVMVQETTGVRGAAIRPYYNL